LGEVARHSDRWTITGAIAVRFDPAGVARWLQPLGSVRSAAGRTIVELLDLKASITVSSAGGLVLSGSDKGGLEALSELFRDWLVSYLNCIGCGACRVTFKRVALRKGRAVMKRGCRPGLDGIREAVLACPVNARGARDCTRLRQDV
jgi:hypothetical protein